VTALEPAHASEHRRRTHKDRKRERDEWNATVAAVRAHPDRFPPGHPLRDRVVAAGYDIPDDRMPS
jgi:hypothetical protein